jgi:hypothetical protein
MNNKKISFCLQVVMASASVVAALLGCPSWAGLFLGWAIMWKLDEMNP